MMGSKTATDPLGPSDRASVLSVAETVAAIVHSPGMCLL